VFNGTTFYIDRINRENRFVGALIHEELTAIWNTIFANQKPEEAMRSLEMMTPVVNIEKFTFFGLIIS